MISGANRGGMVGGVEAGDLRGESGGCGSAVAGTGGTGRVRGGNGGGVLGYPLSDALSDTAMLSA